MAKMGRRATTILNSKDVKKAVKSLHVVSPTHRKVLTDYIQTDGSVAGVVKRTGLTRRQIYNILNKPMNRRLLKRAFAKLGIDVVTAVRVVKHVMLKKGDYHYDFNRLKALELYAKLTGSFAPKKILFKGQLDTFSRREVNKTILKLVRVLHEGKEKLIESGDRT